jgi:hypothetical protein
LGCCLDYLVLPLVTKAQEASKYELYGGFDYIRFNVNANLPGVAPSATYNAYGGGGQFEYNANNWLGAVADLAGYGAFATSNGALIGEHLPIFLDPE